MKNDSLKSLLPWKTRVLDVIIKLGNYLQRSHGNNVIIPNDWAFQMLVCVEEEIQNVREEERQRIKELLFIYTHQWPGDEQQKFCETCCEVIEKGTVCKGSNLKAYLLVEDLLKSIGTKNNKEKHATT